MPGLHSTDAVADATGLDPLLEITKLEKRFGGIAALKGVSLSIRAGEIHALVGENGAGKSTLGKVISGAVSADAGVISVSGQEVAFSSPREALHHGIARMDQELMVVPSLTVLENVLLASEPRSRGMFLREGQARERFADLSARAGVHLDPDALTGSLSVVQQRMVELLRALARDMTLIIMDEPTASLTPDQSETIYATLRRLRADGKTVVYVSHFLDEVLELADTVTVLRDGRVIRTAPARLETKSTLVNAMIGRDLDGLYPRTPHRPDEPVVLSANEIDVRGWVERASFSVRRGEILGIFGLVGSGRSELARAVSGVDPLDGGSISLDGEEISLKTPRDAIRRGLALLPEDRKSQGLCLGRSIAENLTLPYAGKYSRAGLFSARRERHTVEQMMTRLAIKAPNPDVKVGTLSGGNQQKVLFAKWLAGRPKVLIVDEPTRGVDVGAKYEIHELLVELAASGVAVVMISSEVEEVLGLAHRALVMRNGRLVAEFAAATADQEKVLLAAFGSASEGDLV